LFSVDRVGHLGQTGTGVETEVEVVLLQLLQLWPAR
jgi:hypothetical protein